MLEIPKPIVVRRVQGIFKTRQGRGFSEAELRKAGISVADARKLSIRVDPRRQTSLEENVKAIKTWLAGSSKRKSNRKRRRTLGHSN